MEVFYFLGAIDICNDDVCQGQVAHFKQIIVKTEFFFVFFLSFLTQITI